MTDRPFRAGDKRADPAPARASTQAMVSSLGQAFEQVLRRHVPEPAEVAVVGFPNHPNVGDSAIWLGERAWLKAAGHRVRYSADLMSYSGRALSRVVPSDGVILLHGGGNLGDLWPQHEALRQRVMQDFPRHRIVQLPQTVHFQRPEALEQARRVFESCRDLVVLARDDESQRRLEESFDIDTDLAPDPAFALGMQATRVRRTTDIVWLVRTDDEASTPFPQAEHVEAVDWVDDDAGTVLTVPVRRFRATVQTFGRRSRRVPPATAVAQRALIPAFDLLATRRVAFGLTVLAHGRIVVSDRLHAHILSLLLGIPNVVVDTGYGKIRSFFETWTSGCAIARCSPDPGDVPALVRELSDEHGAAR
jgi:pyruvyl transferase EpsO